LFDAVGAACVFVRERDLGAPSTPTDGCIRAPASTSTAEDVASVRVGTEDVASTRVGTEDVASFAACSTRFGCDVVFSIVRVTAVVTPSRPIPIANPMAIGLAITDAPSTAAPAA
jgi:hypothetical protein